MYIYIYIYKTFKISISFPYGHSSYKSTSITLAYSRFWKTKSHVVKCNDPTVIKVTLETTVGLWVWAGY